MNSQPQLKDLPDPYLAQEDNMDIHAIIQSIQDETDEQIERAGVYAIPPRIGQLAGMVEILQFTNNPALLAGSIMAMQKELGKKYETAMATRVYY